jgi:hypothetical protein
VSGISVKRSYMFYSSKKLISLVAIAAFTLLVVFSVVQGESTAVKKAPATAAVKTVVPKAKIVDFEGKATPWDLFWMTVTDSVMQGKSKATISIAPDGAAGTKQSLKIDGSVVQGSNPYVMFAGAGSRFEGSKAIYDVTSYTGIRFWAKADGNTYRIDLPAAAVTDNMFHSFSFTPPTGEWKEYKIPFIGFKQMPFGKKVQWTGTDVQGVHFFTVGGPIEKFSLQVDEIEFYR